MIVVLDNIRSIYNVASIFRTADGAGIEKIYLCGITPEPVDLLGKPRAQFNKISLGAEIYMPWEKIRHTGRILQRLKEKHYRIFLLEQHRASVPYTTIRLSRKGQKNTVLVLGHERKGISNKLLRYADSILEIPMLGKKESLNVAVAFGIAVYHLTAGK